MQGKVKRCDFKDAWMVCSVIRYEQWIVEEVSFIMESNVSRFGMPRRWLSDKIIEVFFMFLI